jgi:RNA polymerase sigma-70 factor, ECF subfamily
VNPRSHGSSGTPLTFSALKLLSDDQLMVQLQLGANDALAVLFERYRRLVFSVALKIVRDRGEAEDVMQNVFLEIFRSVAQFDPAKGTTKVWLLQYAYHRAINRKQHLNARNFYSQQNVDDLEPFLSDDHSALGGYAPGELKQLIQEGLATLGKPQRQVIELASYEGLSMKEIADRTGDSLSNVRHHYYRGLQRLRLLVSQSSAAGKVMKQQ